MRKRILGLTILFMLMAANLYAEPGDVYVDGKLGVGTTTPDIKLTVYSNDSSDMPLFKVENAGTGDATVQF